MPSFPYQRNLQRESFPTVPLSLIIGGQKKEFLALVDSGATISIFRAEVADAFKLDISKGEEVYLGGVGGRIKGFIHKLGMEIAGRNFICPVVFSHEYMVSFNLLGRKVFFEKFRITFEEKRNLISLE